MCLRYFDLELVANRAHNRPPDLQRLTGPHRWNQLKEMEIPMGPNLDLQLCQQCLKQSKMLVEEIPSL